MGLEILGDGGDPLVGVASDRTLPPPRRRADRAGELPREALDLATRAAAADGPPSRRSATACSRPRRAGSSSFVLVGDPPPIGEVARVPHAARPARQEVGVERDDDVGLVEVVDRLARAACGLRAAAARRRATPGRTGASSPAETPASTVAICSASDGDVIGPLRNRRPAP